MILRRGVGAIVPAGVPYFARQASLVPTIINTIAGREFEGGKYGVTRNVLGTNPVLRGSRMRRRGMGNVQYCTSNPPSASQAAYLSANNIDYSIVDCGGTATPQGTNLGNQPVSTIANPNAAPLVAPVYQAPTDIEDCVSMGLATSAGQACVARNTARAVAAENAHIANNQQYQTQLCIANGGGGWVPAGQDVGSWCAGQYGGSVTSGYVPIVSSGPSGTPATAVSGAAVVPAAGAARLSFQNLTGSSSSQLSVGDKWVISIAGARPNAQVGVSGGQNGAYKYAVMGSTDAAGNFSQSGQITADQVGTWQETWGVGDPQQGPAQTIGFVAFTVVPQSPAAGSAPSSSSPSGGGASTPISLISGGGTPAASVTAGTFDIGSFLTGSAFLGLPNWILLAAAAGAVVLLGGKR